MAKKRAATFLGPNKGLSTIGDYAYAYSSAAALTTATGEETRLEFTTGDYVFVGKFNALNGDTSGDTWYTSIFFNGILVMQDKTNNASAGHADNFNVLPVIIPPWTTVKVTIFVGADSDSVSCQFIGRIYNA